jgi:hypothetical protein
MPIVLDPILPTPSPGSSTYPTLSQYRHRLADAAGFNIQATTTATAPQTNQVVVADFQSTELEPSFLGNTWEYQPSGPNAGECRRVVYGGLQNGTGTVTLERAHTNLTPAGTAVEFYGKLPAVRREGRLGLNDIVNKVLNECWTVQRLAIPAVQNQWIYPFGSTFPWLREEDQVIDVYYLGATTDPNARDQIMPSWRWAAGADNPGIEVGNPLNTGDTLKLECFVPTSWWINTGLGFGMASVEGLHAETDQGILPLEGMETIGQAYINLELSKWGLPDDQKQYMGLRAQARAAANEWKRLTLDRARGRKQHWPATMTVPSRDNYGYGYGLLYRG